MTERLISFKPEMIKAICEGKKTQTRRIMKPQPSYDFGWYPGSCGDDKSSLHYANENHFKKGVVIDFPTYGMPGDRLCVLNGNDPSITLEIKNVSVEKLQDISDSDAKKEGAESLGGCHKGHFRKIWESIHGPDGWDKDPWVWVIEFERVEK